MTTTMAQAAAGRDNRLNVDVVSLQSQQHTGSAERKAVLSGDGNEKRARSAGPLYTSEVVVV